MSRMADYHIEKLEELAAKTGYGFDFLYARYIECMLDEDSFEYFEAVTLERDW